MENNIIYELCYNYEYNGKCNDKCKYIHFDRSKCEISEELKRLDEYIKDWSLLEDELSKKVFEINSIQEDIIFLENKYLNESNGNFVNEETEETKIDEKLTENNFKNIPINIMVNKINVEDVESIFINKKERNVDVFENEMEELIDNIKYHIKNSNINVNLKIKFIQDLNKIISRIKLFKMNYNEFIKNDC